MIKVCIVLALLATISLSPDVCDTNVILGSGVTCYCHATDTSSTYTMSASGAGTKDTDSHYCRQVGTSTTYTMVAFPALCTALAGTTVNAKYTGADCKIDDDNTAGNIICTQNGVYKASATSCPIMPEVCGASGATKLKNTIVTGAICECVENTVCLENHYCWPGTPKICNAAKKKCETGLPSAATPFVTGTGYVTDSTLVATDCPTACTDLLCGKCAPGYGTSSCTACTTGTNFKTGPGPGPCTACDNPTCTNGESKKACTTISDAICECAAGFGGGACTACAVGTTFKTAPGSAACTDCTAIPSGKVEDAACTTTTDRTFQCAAGFGGGACTACAVGTTFKTAPGSAACTDCTACPSGKVEDAACTTTTDRTCQTATSTSSSMSLGVQTAVLIGMMNFV